VARGGPASRGVRRAGPKPPRQACGQAAHAQAAQEARARSTCAAHRQAQELRCGEPGPAVGHGTPAAQRVEQPGGELTPANAGAREGDAPLQVRASPAAIRFGARSGGKSVHELPLQFERAGEAAGK